MIGKLGKSSPHAGDLERSGGYGMKFHANHLVVAIHK